MAKPQYPDHAGRMPDHPRYGNPSDPNEESDRIEGAAKNLENWAAKYGGSLSGGVSMQYGSGKKYEVPIGQPEIAQKVVSRPLAASPVAPSLPKATTTFASGPLKVTLAPEPKRVNRLLALIFGDRS